MKSTVPATLVLRPSVPNRVIARIPDSPAVRRCQLSTLPAPSEVTRPLPVTTAIGRPALSRMLPMCSPASLLLGAYGAGLNERRSVETPSRRPGDGYQISDGTPRPPANPRCPPCVCDQAAETQRRGHEEPPMNCRLRDTRIRESCNVRYGTKTNLCTDCRRSESDPSHRRFALEHQAIEQAALVHVVVGIGLVHNAAIVPQHPIAKTPPVTVFVFLLGCMAHQFIDQCERVRVVHANDRLHANRVKEQGLASVLRMGADQRVNAGRGQAAATLLVQSSEAARTVLALIDVDRFEPGDLFL